MSDPITPNRHPFEAAYRGIASIALGVVPLIMTLPTLQFIRWLQSESQYLPGATTGWVMLVLGSLLGAAVLFAFTVFGIIQGLSGRVAARRTGEPRAVCNAGLAIGVLGAISWLLFGSAIILQGQPFLR
jgi:hypothetical protein